MVREGSGIVLPLVGHVLGGVVAVKHGGTDAFPAFWLLRRQEAVRSARRGAVRDAQISICIIQDITLDFAILGLGDSIVVTDEEALPVVPGSLFLTAAAGSHKQRREKESEKFHKGKCFVSGKDS